MAVIPAIIINRRYDAFVASNSMSVNQLTKKRIVSVQTVSKLCIKLTLKFKLLVVCFIIISINIININIIISIICLLLLVLYIGMGSISFNIV